MENMNFKVCISCRTYNHVEYIQSALEGFVSQKTDFPYVCVICDDASNDGESDFLQKYFNANFVEGKVLPDEDAVITFGKHVHNPNCYFVLVLLKYNFYSIKKSKEKFLEPWLNNSKYFAICEGDDFWISENKLQIQVDFLDHNVDYSACLTKFNKYLSCSKKYIGMGGSVRETIQDMLWKDVDFGTATFACRTALYKEYLSDIQPEKQDWLMGDKPLFLYMGHRGKVKMLPIITSVYRILDSSASHSSDINLQVKRARNTIDIYHFFARKYLNENSLWFNKIEGGFLYRVYLFYKDSKQRLPYEYRSKILSYQGKYYKLYIVKLFLIIPGLDNIIYGLVKIKDKMMFKFNKLKGICG